VPAVIVRVAEVQFRTDTKNQKWQDQADGFVLFRFSPATPLDGSGSQFRTWDRQQNWVQTSLN